MTEVRLYTKDGHFVHKGMIPPFNEPPDVIFWGSRHFKFSEESGNAWFYKECFGYALI
jgi:hypothetical protein